MSNQLAKIPTLTDLVADFESREKQNSFQYLLNQEPPASWIKGHPFVKIDEVQKDGSVKKVPMPYLPIDKVEFTLNRIYGGYSTEIKDVKVIANSVLIVVKLTVTNPVTGLQESHDGVGAVAIQTNQGAGAMDWNEAKSNGVQIAAPAAKTYAIKDAAENFGKLFGKDLTRKDPIGYSSFLPESITIEDIMDLYSQMCTSMTKSEVEFVERIIEKREVKSYKKAFNEMNKYLKN